MAQIILTNHVKERASQRGVNIQDLDKTIRFPDQIVQSTTDSSKKHIKSFGSYQVIVPIKRQGNNWIAASAWKNSGSKSVHKQFFLEKLINHFLELLSQKTRLP